MCYIELDKSEFGKTDSQLSNYLLICYSVDCIQPEFVEEEFAILEWLGYIKTYFGKLNEKCVVETVGDYSIILLREKGV